MPRIDPLQLLECLSALLARNGGMKSTHDVKRIASLMQKYSKKLVSKCIYIQILKSSETELLGQFMETGGWTMTHSWLEDAINTDNWPLVQEILELFLLCPVDVTRLRSNSAPKLVKNLSKEGKHERVKILSARLVEQWLKLVKEETVALPATNQQIIVDQGVTRLMTGFQQNAQQMQLLDPSHPSYADSLAIVGDELGGLGALGSADIDVDEIIPTISHHGHHAGMEVGEQEVVDGAFLGTAVSAPSEDVSMDGNILHSSDNHSSLSSNNNVNQNELEKDNLKIKITMKDGKTKVTSSSNISGGKDEEGKSKTSSSSSRSERRSGSTSDKERSKDKKSSSSKSSSSSSSGHKSSSSSSSSSKRGHSSSGKSSSSSSSASSSKDKDKSRERDRSSSHKSTSSSSKSSSSSSRSKESVSQADKDKDTLSKVMGSTSSTMEKLGKIPKKPKVEEGATAPAPPTKKASISIEVCKDPENRPKTVKTFNSQFRNHGLVDDIPPPPSRKTLKKPDSAATTTANKSSTSTTGASLKRASPPKDISPVAEKRLKLEQIVAASPTEEKPGGVKLIAPRSKPILIESDMFMDALCSSAVPTAKGNPKKRKRVASTSKDGSPPPPTTPDSPKIVVAPMKFYQDTLDDNQQSAAGDEAATKEESPLKKAALASSSEAADDATSNNPSSPAKDGPSSPGESADDSKSPTSPAKSDGSSPDSPSKDGDEDMEVEEDNTPKPPGPGCGPNGPPGVLVIHRRRTPKKSVRWRPQESLEEVRLFELDETERVNVTKTFTDMKQMERFGERDAFQMARKLQNDDVMVEQTVWTHLIEVDDVPQTASGGQSKEKDVQAARELTCLQALYFSYNMIPDSASEPEAETYKYAEPAVIPMEDAQNTVNDFTKQGWPEAKEHGAGGPGMGALPFNNAMMGSAFDNPFAAGGPFGGGNQTLPFGGPPGIWSAGVGGGGGGPPFGAPNGVPPFSANLNGDEIQLAMNRLAFPGQTFNPPNFNGINMMNLPAMGAGGPMGGGGPGGGWGFRGGPPMGGGGVWRGHGPPQQPPMNGGGIGHGGPRREWTNNNNNSVSSRPCKNHKKGYCKKGDKCNFSHAGPPGGPGGFRS